ncbi:MAG: hypothetical protein ACLQFR_32245 [Streptosporangiaceae bacterium]
MSSSGDIGGEVSGEEAAWRDLVARFDAPADVEPELAPWPSREDLPGTAAPAAPAVPAPAADPAAGTDQVAGTDQAGDAAAGVYLPADRTRVIRYVGNPRSYSPPEEEDEGYVPVPLPPPPKLDAIAKAAWAGLIGGPLYLLLGTFLHWTISGVEGFAAIAAFVGGFVTLVIKLGDRERDDDDDGAVV